MKNGAKVNHWANRFLCDEIRKYRYKYQITYDKLGLAIGMSGEYLNVAVNYGVSFSFPTAIEIMHFLEKDDPTIWDNFRKAKE